MPDPAAVLAGLPGPALPPVVALVPAVESATTVGLVVPGTAVALAVGAASGVVAVPLPVLAVAAGTGSVRGGQLGYRAGARRRDRWCRWGRSAGRTATLLGRRPSLGVLVGPWLSVGRVLVPRLAGRAGIGPARFTVLHGPSVAAWAGGTTVVGHLLDAVARRHLAGVASAAAVAVGVGIAAWAVRRRSVLCDSSWFS